MGVIAWIVLGLGAGLLANTEPALQPGRRRTGPTASRLSPLPASSGRIR
jgi:hypothetical protein